jgi:hypothetical protein
MATELFAYTYSELTSHTVPVFLLQKVTDVAMGFAKDFAGKANSTRANKNEKINKNFIFSVLLVIIFVNL